MHYISKKNQCLYLRWSYKSNSRGSHRTSFSSFTKLFTSCVLQSQVIHCVTKVCTLCNVSNTADTRFHYPHADGRKTLLGGVKITLTIVVMLDLQFSEKSQSSKDFQL